MTETTDFRPSKIAIGVIVGSLIFAAALGGFVLMEKAIERPTVSDISSLPLLPPPEEEEALQLPPTPDPPTQQSPGGKSPQGDDLLNQPKEVDEGFKPNPRHIVAPVATEPVEPDEESLRKLVAEGKAKGIQFLKYGGWVKYTGDDRRIVLPGVVNMRRGLIEYYVCAENSGKEHETVFEISCDPAQLAIVMNLLSLKKGGLPKQLSIDEEGQGDRVMLSIQWKNEAGSAVTYRAEDLLVDTIRDQPAPRVGWTYIGSYFAKIRDDDTGNEKSYFAASAEKRIVSAFRDPSCILDSPIPEAANNPPIFDPTPSLIPKVGTPILLIIRPLKAEERKEIAEIEKHRLAEPVKEPPK
ncbi:MAG: hypothetical protein A2Z34_06075 [Planctomycetes bacterium RBG_16_59_8]|nr:MAG: hypothetical protein A2Z34_06075 [Planctomycetes bacterium RBG_16_59_8]